MSTLPLRRALPLLLIGGYGGLLSGTFGIGGGIVMVPMIGRLLGYSHRKAAATSLAAILPASIAGAVGYGMSGNVAWFAGIAVAAGGVVGALGGTTALHRIPPAVSRAVFVAVLLAVAVVTLVSTPHRTDSVSMSVTTIADATGVGLITGFASGLLGIGGGVVAVPLLIAVVGASDVAAKGTSLLAIVPTALTGTVNNARKGLVDLREGLTICAAPFACGFPGVALAHLLTPTPSTWAFVALIAAILTMTLINHRRTPNP